MVRYAAGMHGAINGLRRAGKDGYSIIPASATRAPRLVTSTYLPMTGGTPYDSFEAAIGPTSGGSANGPAAALQVGLKPPSGSFSFVCTSFGFGLNSRPS